MLNDPDELLKPFCVGAHYTVKWYCHGRAGDPKKFFDSLDRDPRAILHARISDHAKNGSLAPGRGHEEGWVHEEMPAELVLYKYKGAATIRMYAVIDRSFSKPMVILVFGYKDLKKQKNVRQKKSAESRAKSYLTYRDLHNARKP